MAWQQTGDKLIPDPIKAHLVHRRIIYIYIKWTVFVNVTTKSAQHAHARMIAIIVEKSGGSHFVKWRKGRITCLRIKSVFDCLTIGIIHETMVVHMTWVWTFFNNYIYIYIYAALGEDTLTRFSLILIRIIHWSEPKLTKFITVTILESRGVSELSATRLIYQQSVQTDNKKAWKLLLLTLCEGNPPLVQYVYPLSPAAYLYMWVNG